MKFLESIPKELRPKVEILVNAICPPGCPHRKLHYIETGRAHLTYLKERYTVAHECKIDQELNHPDRLGQGNNLSFEDIKKYNQMGFQHFKLEGRTLSSSTMFANYLYYLIKPEYHFLLIEIAIRKQLFINTYNDGEIFVCTGEKDKAKIGFE
jgi:collagenase-like PrtC family protease